MKLRDRRSPAYVLTLAMFALPACATMKQNLRGQELSYRGAWTCAKKGCSEAQMERSRKGHNEGDLHVAHVKLQPEAALVFTAAAAFDRLDAVVRDCKGKQVPVKAEHIKPPGKHGITAQKDSWVVLVRANDELRGLKLGKKECAIWKVEATGHWSDGATFDLVAGIQVER